MWEYAHHGVSDRDRPVSLSTLVESQQTMHQALFAEEQVLTSVGTQQAFATFVRRVGNVGTSVAGTRMQALGLLQGVVRQAALVWALNDGFMLVCLSALGSMGVVLPMRMSRYR